MTFEDVFDRRVPLAMVLALLVQAGTAVWWAATKDSDDRFLQVRVEHLENAQTQTHAEGSQVLERLARIEERENNNAVMLDRIEKRLRK